MKTGLRRCQCANCSRRVVQLDQAAEQRKYDEAMARQRAREEALNAAWAAKEAHEEASLVKITLRIGVFLDGTGNNPFNVEMGRKCGAHHPVSGQDMDGSCKPYMQDPDSSYGGEVTNVKRLYELYLKSIDPEKVIQHELAFDKVYVEGIGTTAGEQDSLLGAALGRGETGIEARVNHAFDLIKQRLRIFHSRNPNIQIQRLIFDVFGFSRGAAAARHFACLCLNRSDNALRETLNLPDSLFARGFSKV
jgi:hypothetical protein